MTIRVKDELIPLNLLVIVLVVVIICFSSNILRIILGLPFLLFLPGYILVTAPSTKGKGKGRDKALSVILAVVILGALGMLGYVVAIPKLEERFTEFYIEGLEGKAVDYPKELVVGGRGR